MAIVVACLLATSTATAQDSTGAAPVAPSADRIAALDAWRVERIDELQRAFDEAEKPSRSWWTGWLVFNSTMVVMNGAGALAFQDSDARIAAETGAALAGIGVIELVVSRHTRWGFHSMRYAGEFREIRGDTPEARAAKFEQGRKFLKTGARTERDGRKFLRHTGVLFIAAASGAYVYKYGNKTDGLIQGFSTLVLGEATIWTQPTILADAEKRLSKLKEPEDLSRRAPIILAPAPVAGAPGLVLMVGLR